MLRVKITTSKCGLCKNRKEGFLITRFWIFKTFICQSCISRLFRSFTKDL